jgi:hypothetical protein
MVNGRGCAFVSSTLACCRRSCRLGIATGAGSLVWDQVLVEQAGDAGYACRGQFLRCGVRPAGPHDHRRGPGIQANQVECLSGRPERLPGEDEVVDQVDWRARWQALVGEPRRRR